MKLGINQPYFFPYIGFWQLINAVDKYVIGDTVNYIRHGYINRNSILIQNAPHYFRIPLKDASPNKYIYEIDTALTEKEITKLLSTIKSAYGKAPFFDETYEHIKTILEFGLKDEGRNLSDFLDNAIRLTSKELGITTPIMRLSKDIPLEGKFDRQSRIVAICNYTNTDEYINAIGGKTLYFNKFFNDNGIKLKFLNTHSDIQYKQFNSDTFVPNLSIIDTMMFNTKERISEMLQLYTLEDGFETPEEVVE